MAILGLHYDDCQMVTVAAPSDQITLAARDMSFKELDTMFCCDPSYNDPYAMAVRLSAFCVGGAEGNMDIIRGDNTTEPGNGARCFVRPVVSMLRSTLDIAN